MASNTNTVARVKTAPMHPRILPYANVPVVALDTETTGLDWWDRAFRVGGYVLYAPDVGADYIPVGHETMFDSNEDHKHVASSIATLAKDPAKRWLMHNRQYDENVCAQQGITFKGEITDTIGLWWTIDSHHRTFALKGLGAEYIDPNAATEEQKLKRFIETNKLKRYTQVPVDFIGPYAKQDGILTYKLWELGMKRLDPSQYEVHALEQRWIALLSKISRRGVDFDVDLAHEIIDNHLAEAHRVRLDLAKRLNYPKFNPNSPIQVMTAASRMGVTLASAEADVVLASELPREVRLGIVKYKQLIHTVGSYLEPMIRIAQNSFDGRVHTSWRTTPKTGRLASSDPINMQGLPRQKDEDHLPEELQGVHRVRETIRAPEGADYVLGFNDYAQIDVRIGAHYAREQGLIDVLSDPKGDIHTFVNLEMRAMGLDINRSDTKPIVFSSQYGVGKTTFASHASGLKQDGTYRRVSEDEAGVWLVTHRRRFPGIAYTLKQVEQVMRSRGYIFLFDGKVMGCPPWEDPHKAFAWLIQGSGAQALKRAMVAADDEIQRLGLNGGLNMQIHDEVGWHSVYDQAEVVGQIVADSMAFVWKGFRVPLYVQPAIAAPSWAKEENIGHVSPRSLSEWQMWRQTA